MMLNPAPSPSPTLSKEPSSVGGKNCLGPGSGACLEIENAVTKKITTGKTLLVDGKEERVVCLVENLTGPVPRADDVITIKR